MMLKPVLNLLPASAIVVTTTAMAGQVPMPPSFNGQSDPETVLRVYPLGVITKQAAFSHHGKATQTLILFNDWQALTGPISGNP